MNGLYELEEGETRHLIRAEQEKSIRGRARPVKRTPPEKRLKSIIK